MLIRFYVLIMGIQVADVTHARSYLMCFKCETKGAKVYYSLKFVVETDMIKVINEMNIFLLFNKTEKCEILQL